MKRILLLVALFIGLANSYVFAVPLEGTVMPKKGGIMMGAETNFVNKRDIEYIRGNVKTADYFVTGSYGVTDNFCLDGKLGIGSVDYYRSGMEELNYENGFAGGYGLRVKLWPHEDNFVNFIVGFHHISVHPQSYDDNTGLRQRMVWDEWQADSMMYKEFKKFIPYVGLKVKRLYLRRHVNDGKQTMKTDTELGVAAGFDYKIAENWNFNAETDFVNEESYNCGITYSF